MPAPADQHDPRADACAIVRILRDAGHIAYFAGGCVRDELLGLEPSDYDIATDATPDRVRTLFPRSSEVGKCFGVVIVNVSRDVVEVATFRSDGAYSDSRRPDSVRFSTPDEDAHRRDFTVNALFLDPFADGETCSPRGGKVIDLVGGLADLSRRVLRAVGDPDARLAEDHLRALRAVRLAAKLGFDIDPGTAAAIRRHAAELRGVSRERIGDELRRMLLQPARARAAAWLADLGLEVPVLAGTPVGEGSRDWAHLASLPARTDYPAALAAWALDLGLIQGTHAACVTTWRRSLCLSNDDRDALGSTMRLIDALQTQWSGLSVAGRKRLAAQRWFAAAAGLVGVRSPDLAAAIARERDRLAATPSGIAPTPLLTGDDLIREGWKPGPAFKGVLDAVYDAQLEEKIRTRPQAMELAASLRVETA